jgi:hemolysin activation/secretion protein
MPLAIPRRTICRPEAAVRPRLPTALLLISGMLISAAAAETARRFDVEEYRVEGNSVLADTTIEDTVYPFLGPSRTAEDVERARAALEAVYNKQGYPTVSVVLPAQSVRDGVIVLKVVERRVGRLRVTGARYFAPNEIRTAAPSLAEGSVPRMADVQHDILALNQWPDRTVTPVLRPGAVPDTVDVDLQVKDSLPLHASVELNNRHSADTTPLRSMASLSYDNLWQRGDSASVSFQVAPQRPADATIWSGAYLFRIPNSRLSLLASYLNSNSNVATFGGTTVIGRGSVFGLRLLVPIETGAGFSQSLSIGPDRKNFIDITQLSTSNATTPVLYYPVSFTWQAGWSGTEAQTNASVSVVAALPGVGSNTAAFQAIRAYAEPNFGYFRFDASRQQELPYGMQAYLHVLGQLTDQPLISNEQFSLGGLDSVRGYLESEALGDYGVAAQAELRSWPLAGEGDVTFNGLRAYAFLDGGDTAIHQPLPEQRSSTALASLGLGMRVRVREALTAEVDGAYALADGPTTKAGTTAVLFRVNGGF